MLLDLIKHSQSSAKLCSAFSWSLTPLVIQTVSFRALLLLNSNQAASTIKCYLKCYFFITLKISMLTVFSNTNYSFVVSYKITLVMTVLVFLAKVVLI